MQGVISSEKLCIPASCFHKSDKEKLVFEESRVEIFAVI